jgi:hypothetical protein
MRKIIIDFILNLIISDKFLIEFLTFENIIFLIIVIFYVFIK